MRHLYILLLLLLLVGTSRANAQFAADTARGLVGEEVRLPLRYVSAPDDTLDVITLAGEFLLSNSTVQCARSENRSSAVWVIGLSDCRSFANPRKLSGRRSCGVTSRKKYPTGQT